jgi:Bacterial Ig-like domain
MRFAKHLMFVGVRFAILCSLPHLFGGVSTAQTTDDVTVANNTKPLSNEIGARRGNSVAQNSSSVTNRGTVHVRFGLDTPESGVFPTDIFTVADDTQKTGLRTKLPLPDCAVRVSDCRDLTLINVLDGFNLQPRVTIPFDGDIAPSTVNSKTAFFVELGDADVDTTASQTESGPPRVIGVNQLIWDPATRVLAIESDEQLRQHTRYAFVITTGIRDTSGSPVKMAEELTRFRHDLNNGQTSRLQPYREKLLNGLAALRRLGVSEEQVAGLSVFTTQSATAVIEHIRDKLKAATPDRANFRLGPGGGLTVFLPNSIQDIDWQQQIKVNPPAFQTFNPQYPGETSSLALLDQYKPGAVGRIAYGTFRSPRYVTDEPVMPPVGTRDGAPPVQEVESLYVNVFLPAGTQPPKGWPVVVFGLGGGDYKEEMPWLYAAAFASHGLATACINVVGQAFGPLSFVKVILKGGRVIQFPAGGRGRDLDGDGVIKDNEGVATVSPAYKTLGARDTIRQQVIDLMQLVRVIEVGVDVDGDGVVDLDPSQISYFGLSFGAGALGHVFMAVEPNVKVGVLASPAGMNSRFDLLRMRPAARGQAGQALASRVPPLLNSPGLTTWGGIPVVAPFFNENIPLRNQPIVVNQVAGAMDIQKYLDEIGWIAASGDGVSYAPHIREEPLTRMSPKSILINFGKGDESAPNPRTTQLLRAGGYADVATFYRNDLAYAEDNTVYKNPHTYVQKWMLPGLSGPIGRGGMEQFAIFLASHGKTIVHPEPARFFEVPISAPLPEDFSYIP